MKRKSKIRGLFVVVFAIAIAFSLLTVFPGDHRRWTVIGAQAVDDPATGMNSGICGFYVFETGSTYTANLTDAIDGYLAGGSPINATNLDTPHDKNFDLIVWGRFNITDSELDLAFVLCNMTWIGNISSTEAPDHIYKTGNNASMMWVNFVWDNDDTGYDIKRNEKDIPIDDIIIKSFK